jgi:hypothetical protein
MVTLGCHMSRGFIKLADLLLDYSRFIIIISVQ